MVIGIPRKEVYVIPVARPVVATRSPSACDVGLIRGGIASRFPANAKCGELREPSFAQRAASGELGSQRSCGAAARGFGHIVTPSSAPDDSSQPKPDSICATA